MKMALRARHQESMRSEWCLQERKEIGTRLGVRGGAVPSPGATGGARGRSRPPGAEEARGGESGSRPGELCGPRGEQGLGEGGRVPPKRPGESRGSRSMRAGGWRGKPPQQPVPALQGRLLSI